MTCSPDERVEVHPFTAPTLPSSPPHTVTLSSPTPVMMTPSLAPPVTLHTSPLVTTHTPHCCAPVIIPVKRVSDTAQNEQRASVCENGEVGRVGGSEDGECGEEVEEPVVRKKVVQEAPRQTSQCIEQVQYIHVVHYTA